MKPVLFWYVVENLRAWVDIRRGEEFGCRLGPFLFQRCLLFQRYTLWEFHT